MPASGAEHDTRASATSRGLVECGKSRHNVHNACEVACPTLYRQQRGLWSGQSYDDKR